MFTSQIFETLNKILAALKENLPHNFIEEINDPTFNKNFPGHQTELVARKIYMLGYAIRDLERDNFVSTIIKQTGIKDVINEESLVNISMTVLKVSNHAQFRAQPGFRKLTEINEFYKNFTRFVEILNFSKTAASSIVLPEGMGELNFVIKDDVEGKTDLSRLIQVLQDLENLLSIVNGFVGEEDTVKVIYLDSGSPSLFKIEIKEKALEIVGHLFKYLLDQDYRESEKVKQDIENITKILSATKKVGELVESGKIKKEDADNLNSALLKKTEKIINRGGTTLEQFKGRGEHSLKITHQEQKMIEDRNEQKKDQTTNEKENKNNKKD